MSAESAYLSTFGAETETEAEIRSTSIRNFRKLTDVPARITAGALFREFTDDMSVIRLSMYGNFRTLKLYGLP